MIGAVLAATDPAILIPLFERLRLRPKVAQTVIAESAFNDPTGTVLTLTLASVVTAGSVDLGGRPATSRRASLLGRRDRHARRGALAVLLSDTPLRALARVAGRGDPRGRRGGVLRQRGDRRSGYLAAFVMGLVVGNMDLLGIRRPEEHFAVLEHFSAQAAEVAMLAVFVTLGLNLPLDALRDDLCAGLAIMAVFILVARPLTVFACLLPDRRGGWTREELLFLCWCRETGVVPAAVASLLVAQASRAPSRR